MAPRNDVRFFMQKIAIFMIFLGMHREDVFMRVFGICARAAPAAVGKFAPVTLKSASAPAEKRL
jgi:hypothetical protein